MKTIRRHASLGFKKAAACKLRALFAAGLLLSGASAFAAAPAAKTPIGNTASATYKDSLGADARATSNTVTTIVQQVGAFAVDGVVTATGTGSTHTGLIGGTITVPHILTNTGNGSDQFRISVVGQPTKFSRIEIFQDNGSGVPVGSALCSSASGTSTCEPVAPVTLEGSNGTYQFLVVYTVPPAATIPAAGAYGTATVAVTPIASALYGPVKSITLTDSVNLTAGAAFAMTKKIGSPDSRPPPGGAWPAPNNGGKVSPEVGCPTTWSAVATLINPSCAYTVYTLSFTNAGTDPGAFAFSDTLPIGLTYVAGSAMWSHGGGTVLTDAPAGDPTGIDYQFSGNKLTGVVQSVAGNSSQSVSFVVLVNSLALPGNGQTSNTAYYNTAPVSPTTNSNNPGPLPTATTTVPYSVSGNYRVAIGSASSNGSNAADSTAGTPNSGTEDTTVVASAVAGTTVMYTQKVYNLGDNEDTIDLEITNSNFPAGTSYFFYSDNGTPLTDTGIINNKYDTGPMLAHSERVIKIGFNLPPGLLPDTTVYTAMVTATSAKDRTKSDTTRDVLQSISAGLVDLTNTENGTTTALTGDKGPGPSINPTVTKPTTKGVAASFDLYIANNDSAGRRYNLTYSASENFETAIPSGWQVTFLPGLAANCAAGTPVTVTDTILPGARGNVTACVKPGSGQTPLENQKFYFRVRATEATANGVFAQDTVTDAVTVELSLAEQYASAFSGDKNGEVGAGGIVDYVHLLTATGAKACAAYVVDAKIPDEDVAAGWTAQVFVDTDRSNTVNQGDLLMADAAPLAASLQPGSANAQHIIVRIKAPQSASVGKLVTAKVTATFAAPNSCGAPVVTDITTVSNAAVEVVKLQAIDSACNGTLSAELSKRDLAVKPGECIHYSVKATNTGKVPLNNLTIHDAAPGFTKLNGIGAQCVGNNVTGTAVYAAAANDSVSCGVGSTGNNVVQPNGSLTLDYSVRVHSN